MTVPEINGKPAAKILVGLEEKIGLPNYSNVVVGPIQVERYVEDDPTVIEAELRLTLENYVEPLMVEERTKVLELISGQ